MRLYQSGIKVYRAKSFKVWALMRVYGLLADRLVETLGPAGESDKIDEVARKWFGRSRLSKPSQDLGVLHY
jgi:hypothetical protein